MDVHVVAWGEEIVTHYPMANVALLSNIENYIKNCKNSAVKEKGCKYCSIQMECGCSYVGNRLTIQSKLNACTNLRSETRHYPVNLALLSHFFKETQLEKLIDSTDSLDSSKRNLKNKTANSR